MSNGGPRGGSSFFFVVGLVTHNLHIFNLPVDGLHAVFF